MNAARRQGSASPQARLQCPTLRRSHGIIVCMRDQPRQIYTSVRKPRGLSALVATRARIVCLAGLSILLVATVAIAIVTLA
jgi:hypothetical protein